MLNGMYFSIHCPALLTHPSIYSPTHPSIERGRQERLLGPSDWAGSALGLREEPGWIISYHWHSESKYTLQHSHTRLCCSPCPRTKLSQADHHPPYPHHTALHYVALAPSPQLPSLWCQSWHWLSVKVSNRATQLWKEKKNPHNPTFCGQFWEKWKVLFWTQVPTFRIKMLCDSTEQQIRKPPDPYSTISHNKP